MANAINPADSLRPLNPSKPLSEAQRQNALLAALRTPCPPIGPLDEAHPAHALLMSSGWEPNALGLRAYQINAQALAVRALSHAYPTVLTMLGDEAMAHLAHLCWMQYPPRSGDIGQWGTQLPTLLESQNELAAWPWLADVARLDWARHSCAQALDAELDAASLNHLGDTAPEHLRLHCRPGTQLLTSPWPAGALWRAHQWPPDARDAAVAQAIAQATAQVQRPVGEAAQLTHTLVWRQGWHVRVLDLSGDTTIDAHADSHGQSARADLASAARSRWMQALLATPAATLAQALALAGPDFDVSAWLAEALQEGWLWRAEVLSC